MKRQTEVATFMGLPLSMVQRRVTPCPMPCRMSWKAGSTTGGTGDPTEQQTGMHQGAAASPSTVTPSTSDKTGTHNFQGAEARIHHTKSKSHLTIPSDWAGATFYLSPTYKAGVTFSKHSSHTVHCLEELPSSALSCENCSTSSCITAWIQSSDLIRMTGPVIQHKMHSLSK